MAKYFFCVFAVLAANKILTRRPVLSVALHIISFFLCNVFLLFLNLNLAAVIFLALMHAVSEIFYIVAQNVIFAVRAESGTAAVIQAPFTAGVLLAGIVKHGFSLDFRFSFWLILIALAFHIVSLLPLLFDRQIPLLNAQSLQNEIKRPYKNPKRDMFHISLGLFNGVVFEVIPLYLVFSQNALETSLIIFASIEISRLFFTKAGEHLYKKGHYNFAMALSTSLFFILLALAAVFDGTGPAPIFCAVAAAAAPLNFVPKFSAYVKAVKEENRIHYNQLRREFLMSAGKILAPAAFLIFGAFVAAIFLGAVAGVGIFFASYNYKLKKAAAMSAPAAETEIKTE